MSNEESFIEDLNSLLERIIFCKAGNEPATEKQFLDILDRYEKEIREIPGFADQSVFIPVYLGLSEKFKTGHYTILDAARYINSDKYSDKYLVQLVEEMKHPKKNIENVISEKMSNEESFIKDLDSLMRRIIFYEAGDRPATEKQFLDILNRYEKEIREIPGFADQSVLIPVYFGLKASEKFKKGYYTILDAARYIKSDKDLVQLVEEMKHPKKNIENVISEKMSNEKSFIEDLDSLMERIIFYEAGDKPATEKQFLDILDRYEKEIREIPGFADQSVHISVWFGLKVAEKFKTGDYTILDAARYIKSDKDLVQLVEEMKHPEKNIENVINEKLITLSKKAERFEVSDPAVRQFILNREVVSQEYHGLRTESLFNFESEEDDGPSEEELTTFALYTAYTNPKELQNVMGDGMDSYYQIMGVAKRIENVVVEHFTTGKGRFLFFTPNEKENENSLADILDEQSVQRNIEKFVAIASVLTPEQLSKGIEKMPEKTKAQIAACLKRQKDSNSI